MNDLIKQFNEGDSIVSVEYTSDHTGFMVYREEEDWKTCIRTFTVVKSGVRGAWEYTIVQRAGGIYHVLLRKKDSDITHLQFMIYYGYYVCPTVMIPKEEFFGWDKFMGGSQIYWQCTFIESATEKIMLQAAESIIPKIEASEA